MLSKQQILTALQVWIRQRPGLEFGNYGELKSYRSELRSIAKDKRDAEALLTAVSLRDSITAADLLKAFSAFSGRLSISEVERPASRRGEARLDYCTGQYWPTEYRKAACAVLASALWQRKREDMPRREFVCGDGAKFPSEHEAVAYANSRAFKSIISVEERYNGMTAGDWIRSSFRREFGRSMQARWFN